MSKTHFIIIGPLNVDGLLANQPDLILGFPMPTAVAGFGYKVIMDLKNDMHGTDIVHLGTAVVVHDHSFMEGHSKNPVTKSDPTIGAPIVDEIRGRAVLSFVIKVSGLGETTNDARTKIAQRIPGMFFGGGKVFPIGSDLKSLVTITTSGSLNAILKKVRPGFVLFDRHDLMEFELDQQGDYLDPLDAILNCVELLPIINNELNDTRSNDQSANLDTNIVKYKRRHDGWIVALLVGYQGLEATRKRIHGRNNTLISRHSYVESLYSLGEYKSLTSRTIVFDDEDVLNGAFWHHNYNKDTETYYVSAITSTCEVSHG